MASKRRIRRNACDGKQRHETPAEAWAHINSLTHSGKYNGANAAYRCRFCGGYHVGHPPKGRVPR